MIIQYKTTRYKQEILLQFVSLWISLISPSSSFFVHERKNLEERHKCKIFIFKCFYLFSMSFYLSVCLLSPRAFYEKDKSDMYEKNLFTQSPSKTEDQNFCLIFLFTFILTVFSVCINIFFKAFADFFFFFFFCRILI